ncbi:bactericidal permeability-increasing protein [Microcaecilia unicolor]|uniref:Bactericidal permeability-increasing protein n=1 Tax=Microcaecilia unicolor TaxID=1415580 RepID=A0A6P7YHY8_9AMPH|nr:bactericidal permeability-increasing protein [Microcaecilia unicolor]
MAWRLAVAFMVAVYVENAGAINPGFVVRVTNKGLDYARQIGITVLQKELSTIKLPDFSGTFHIKHLGKGYYSFHDLVIRNFQLPSSQVEPVPNVGLKLSISDGFVQLDGQWHVKKSFIKDHGSFDLKVEGLSVSVGLALGSDSSGRPTVSAASCSSHISNVRVHISGKLSWLLDLFHKKIDAEFRKVMEDKICPVVSESINSKLQPILQTLPVTAKIDHIAGVDYSLLGPPIATAESVDVNLKGECFDLAHRSTVPFPPPAIAFPVDHNLMVYCGVSDYFFNTASFVYQAAGALIFNVTDDMIPKDFQMRLNTSTFGSLIPQVQKMYPNMLMKLMMSTPSAPVLKITPGNLTIAPALDFQAFAILPNSSLAPLFLLGVTTDVSAKIAVNSTRIVGSLALSRLQMTLKHSDVGPFSVALLDVAVNFYVSNILLPQINGKLERGFPLPLLDHVQLTDLILKPQQDFLQLGANINYG